MAEKTQPKTAARKVKDKWKSKNWYTVIAPDMFNRMKLAETLVDEPDKMLGRILEVTVQELTGDFAKAYGDLVALTPADLARIQGALTPLRARLPATVAEMVRGDRESELQCAGFAARLVGETRIQDHFAAWDGDGVKAITNWSNRVKQRVERWFRR